MREETIDVAEKQPLVKVPVEEFGADVLEEIVAMEEPAEEMVETIFQSMDFGRLVLRRRCNYRTWTKIEVMKEVFGFDKIERGLLHIVVQSSHIS